MFAFDSRWRRAAVCMPAACTAVGVAAAQQPVATPAQATTVAGLQPEAVAYDSAGNLYIALRNDHVVRKIDLAGNVSTVAGTGQQGFGGDGGAGSGALLDSPTGLAVDLNGNLYIADSRNHRIRRVAAGVITTVAGSGVAGFGGDNGPASAAQLNLPTALSVDAVGSLYIADSNNHRVRRLTAGVISTLAGTGEQGFSGDGAAALAAQLDTPMGVAVDSTSAGAFFIADTHNQRIRRVDASGVIATLSGDGSVAGNSLLNPRGISADASGRAYFADSGNELVRALTGTTLSTLAGSSEQGFAGDLGLATSAVLDTPRATAVGPNGLVAVADSRNQRVRVIASSRISTVSGFGPDLTERLLLSGPTSGTFGTSAGRLSAVFSSPVGSATGSVVLNVNGQSAATAALVGNMASFDLGLLTGGLQTLAVSYQGDAVNAPVVSGVYLVSVAAAAQTLNFTPLQTPVTFVPGATIPLNSTASSGLPVTYQVTGPATVAGSTLTLTGSGTVTVTAVQAGSANYAAVSAVQTVLVSPSPLVAATVDPRTIPFTTAATPITVTGSGFTATSVVRVNGVAAASSVQGFNVIRATLPAVTTTAPLSVTVYDPASQFESNALAITAGAPAVTATLTAPATGTSAQQPALSLALQNSYPVDLAGVFTMTFASQAGNGADDSSIVFISTGSRRFPFVLTAGSTVLPPIAFQTGTLAGTVTITLALTAAGVDVTPASARVVNVAIPAEVPTATTVSFTQSGPTLTVTLVGYANTKSVTQATFNFTPTAGTSLAAPSLTLPVTTIFNDWFSSTASSTEGSLFTYRQTFNLSDADAKVQSVTVTLTNGVGSSSPKSTP